MPDTAGARSPFATWLDDRAKPVPPWDGGPNHGWLNAEPDDTVSVWCWPCTTGPEAWIARIPDEGHNPDYTEQVTRAVIEHVQAAHAGREAADA